MSPMRFKSNSRSSWRDIPLVPPPAKVFLSRHQQATAKQPSEEVLNLRKVNCLSELQSVPVIAREFAYIPGLFKCIHCHNLEDESGIESPLLDEYCYESSGKSKIQTRKFRNCKRSLQAHLSSRSHIKNVSDSNEQDYYNKRRLAHEELAGFTAAILIYQMVKCKDSYRSYEDRITAVYLMPGATIGDKNLSRETPPKFIRTMGDVLKKSMRKYISGLSDHLSFLPPISVTADKDTSKHRARQVNINYYYIYITFNLHLQVISCVFNFRN